VIGFDDVARVLLEQVPRATRQLVDDPRIDRCSIGRHLDRRLAEPHRMDEESPRSRRISALGDQDVDDLPMLIDGPVEVGPAPATLTYVSSTNHRSPTACRRASAASMNSGVKVCTHLYTVT
jgi:hypothetical protein